MSARSAKGAGPLAQLVRERQDLVGRRAAEDKHLLAAVGQGDALATEIARKSVASLDLTLNAVDARLSSEFQEYAELANPKPLTIAAVQALLNEGEALVLFLDVPQFGHLPGETLIWVVTKADGRWTRIELASQALAERAAALRCGLDRGAWEGQWKPLCRNLLASDIEQATDGRNPLPFDLTRAHQLYQALFGQVEDLIKGKHLLIVPSGPLTQIPFHVLVTEQADPAATGNEAFRQAAWFAKTNSITVLPAVSSLKALRDNAKASQAKKPFVGFGNPLLDGPDSKFAVRAKMACVKQQCPKSPGQRVSGLVAGGITLPQQRGGLVDVASVRAQVPLPETADELCAVARDLGVPDSDIRLGARAKEREVKRLSDSGELATYRIVHFATHGALAGELKAGAEPGLILTPPDEASPEDDGYLSASEIAGLKLDADWVILSACNTAASGTESAEALSGMSRAFFYAGARALLVSHWAVDSDATVKLITKTLSTMAAVKTIGRSEALRRSMVALIEQGALNEAHPAYWAPFVVVGEGSAGVLAPAPIATSSIIPVPQASTKPAPSAPRARPKRAARPDWRNDVWRQ
jgi:CHAT domain-containing protein